MIKVEKVEKVKVERKSRGGYESPPPKRRRAMRQRVTSVVATKFKDSTPQARLVSKKILEDLKNS